MLSNLLGRAKPLPGSDWGSPARRHVSTVLSTAATWPLKSCVGQTIVLNSSQSKSFDPRRAAAGIRTLSILPRYCTDLDLIPTARGEWAQLEQPTTMVSQ